MKKDEIVKDPEILAMMCRFVRSKRILSQKEVADLAGVSQATVAFLETANTKKVSIKNFRYVLKALRLNSATLNDPSLTHWIMSDEDILAVLKKKYGNRLETVVKSHCAAFDSYTALLWWKYNLPIASKSSFFIEGDREIKELREREEGPRPMTDYERFLMDTKFPNYLASWFIYDILKSLPRDILIDIFYVSRYTLNTPSLVFEERLFDGISTGLDPFKKFMKHLQIPFTDYFNLISEITSKISSLRSASFEKLENLVMKITGEIYSILNTDADNTKLLLRYIEAINATEAEVSEALQQMREKPLTKGTALSPMERR